MADGFTVGEMHVVFPSPGGVDGVADCDNVSRPAHIQVWPREGDEAGVSHSVLVPAQHITKAEGYLKKLRLSWNFFPDYQSK